MSINPMISFPIKKRINTELFIDVRAQLYIQKCGQNFLAEFEEGKNVGVKTNNR